MQRLDAFELGLRGTTLIEASAGTGKTFTITTLYLRLVLEEGLEVSNILVITFTRAATSELRDRIRKRLDQALRAFEALDADDDPVLRALLAAFDTTARQTLAKQRLSSALADFDAAAILTIHGFCQRALSEYAFESRSAFDVDLLVDQSALLYEVAADHWSKVVEREESIVVEHLQAEHPRIERWIGVARYGAEAAPPHVIPDRDAGPPEAIRAFEARWLEAVDRVRARWERCADEVIELLCKAEGLNRKSYDPEKIASTWGAEAEALLANPRSLLRNKKLRGQFERFGNERLKKRTNQTGTTPTHPFFDTCDELIESTDSLVEALRVRRVAIERELIHETTRALESRKRELARQSYDDLLTRMGRALEGQRGLRFKARLRSEFQAALVDEFQDTDQLQYQIVRTIWHEASLPLFLIGDPKQAIYAFRGADVNAYLRARRDAEERCFTLEVNWRSDPALIGAIASLFERRENPFGIDAIQFARVEARPGAKDALASAGGETAAALELLFVEREGAKALSSGWVDQHVAPRVAAEIARLLESDTRIDGEPVKPQDIAVLCRSNHQTQRMVDALRDVGVTGALLGDASVFDTEEAREIERVLEAIAEARSLPRIRAALSTRIFGVDAAQFEQWAEDDPVWDEWLERFAALQRSWSRDGFIRMFHALLRDQRAHDRLLRVRGGERRLANWLHLSELAERAAQDEHLGPAGTVQWLSRMRSDQTLRGNAVGEEGELRLESDREAVRVVTIHKSKGLEYPIVYCPFLFGSAALRSKQKARVRFHAASDDAEGDAVVTLDLGSPDLADHIELAEAESHGEAMRMLYVALTRAKHRCSVVWGAINGAEKSALFRLLHPELETKEVYKKNDDAALRGELEEFAAAARGSCVVRTLGDEPAPRPARADLPAIADGPTVTRALDRRWRHSSFSQLAASERDRLLPLPPLRAEGEDRDEVASAPDGFEAPDGEVEAERPFAALRSGARTGVLLHSLLEHLDFESPVAEQLAGPLCGELDTHGVESTHRDALARDLQQVLAAPIDEQGLRLAGLAKSARLDEAEFLIPVGHAAASSELRGIDASDLADVFRAHASGPIGERLASEYAPRIERLHFETLAGFLRGFVDLVFEWQGRFYVVDYKSNQLGDQRSAYRAEALLAPMIEHHYVLQYHLYTVAIDRHLAQRVAGYDYDTHFGGVYYLFLRGMDAQGAEPNGVYAHRPQRKCIEALSGLFGREGGVAV